MQTLVPGNLPLSSLIEQLLAGFQQPNRWGRENPASHPKTFKPDAIPITTRSIWNETEK